ncbi:hypothetical protein BMS3Bbin10_02874 [bacterium BMS3Bbin10]|nr:hypothetical protein BMS3Bbin10_02874 [bacterium BMS3Bbin10]
MQFAQLTDPAPPPHPAMSRRQEGPFGELDMLAIGTVLLAVLLILAVRKVFGKRD